MGPISPKSFDGRMPNTQRKSQKDRGLIMSDNEINNVDNLSESEDIALQF